MKPLFGLVVLTVLICSSMAVGQTVEDQGIGYPALREANYNYFGGSARAMGMGYAFVGLSNDVSSGLWNPAGLWVLEGPIVSASYNVYSPAGQFSTTWSPVTTQNNLGMDAIGHFSLVAPVRIKGHPWVFTFNYNRNNEFSDKSAWVHSLASGLNPDSYDKEERYERTFNIGGSTRIYNQLSLGFTLNIMDASRVIDWTRLTARDTIITEVPLVTASLMESDELIDSTKSSGFNFNVGLMFKEDKFSVGAVVHTPFTIKHNSDRTRIITSTMNGLESIDNSSVEFVVDSLAKQDVPLSFILGGAFFPMEKLTLTLDATFQNYASTNWYYNTLRFFEPNGERTDTYEEIPIDWNNTFGIGSGVEYLVDSKYGRIPLRAGLRYDQLPQPADFSYFYTNYTTQNVGDSVIYTMQPYVTTTRKASERQNTMSFSLGTGIHWSQIEIDIAYMYTSGAKLKWTEDASYYIGDDDDGNPVIVNLNMEREWEWKSHEFRFTFTGYF